MKKIIIFICCFVAFKAFGQQATTSSVTSKSDNFIIVDNSGKQLIFTYTANVNTDGSNSFKLTSKDCSPTIDGKSFNLYNLDENLFLASFLKLFAGVTNISDDNIKDKGLSIFHALQNESKPSEEQPNTAHLKLITSVLNLKLGYTGSVNKKRPELPAEIGVSVDQVDIEFEDGTIKNVIIKIKPNTRDGLDELEDGIIQFRNNYPIGISGKFSPERLRDNNMFAYDPIRVQKVLGIKSVSVKADTTKKNDSIKIKKDTVAIELSSVEFNLADLIDYRIILESGKEDYSPANQVVTLSLLTNDIIVKKEQRSKIFQIRTYTDLVGINGDQPNGLIQVEGSKKIFLLEDKKRFFSEYAYIGGLAYFEPVLRYSKIDNNNKNFIPDTAGSTANLTQSGKKVLNLNTIDLYKYQQSSLTFNLNLIELSFPQIKLNFLIDAKAGIYRTSIADSLMISSGKLVKGDKANITTVNTTLYGMNFIFQLLSDSRYGLSLGYSIFENKMMNQNYIQNKGFAMGTYWLDGSFKTSDSATIFVRGSMTQQLNNKNLNFLEAQVGVTLDIFKANAK